jgi:hypothetical protein
MSSTHTFENVSDQIMQWIGVNKSDSSAQDGPVWAEKGVSLAYRDPNEELEEILSERLPEGDAKDEMIVADAKSDWDKEEEEVSADADAPTEAEGIVEGALEGGLTDPVTVGAILLGGGAIALAAGGGGGGSKYYAPSDNTEGFFGDGPISGAGIFLDRNLNGVADDGEKVATTNSNGKFSFYTAELYPIIGKGGIDTTTDLPNTMDMITPVPTEEGRDSVLINPITTVVQGYIEQTGASVAVAEEVVQDALGIGGDVDLTTYNPFDSANEGSAASVEVQKVNAQIAALTTVAAKDNLGGNALEAITKKIADNTFNADNTIDLKDEGDLGSINDEIGNALVLQVDSTSGDIANDTLVGGYFTDADIDNTTASVLDAGKLSYEGIKGYLSTGDTISFSYNDTIYTATLTDGIDNLQTDINAATGGDALTAGAVTYEFDGTDLVLQASGENTLAAGGEFTDVDIVKTSASIDVSASTDEGAKATYTGIK